MKFQIQTKLARQLIIRTFIRIWFGLSDKHPAHLAEPPQGRKINQSLNGYEHDRSKHDAWEISQQVGQKQETNSERDRGDHQ